MFKSAVKPIWWLPSLGFFIFLFIEAAMFHRSWQMLQDPSVGRHLRTAQVIMETGQIPRVDPLTFSQTGQPWVDYEWAFEATIGQLYRLGGLGLVCAFGCALFSCTILGLYRLLLHSGFSTSVMLLYMSVAFLTLHLHLSVRPVLFTYLFMMLVIEVWNRRTYPLKRDWLLLPLVFIAWANLHAGWAAALIFLVGSIAGRILDRIFKRATGDEAPVIPWIGLTLLCAVATSVNPWGWHLHHNIFLYSTSYQSFALWTEYHPPDFAAMNMTAQVILFLLAVVIFSRTMRRAPLWRWETVLPVAFFLYEGLKAQRHVLFLIEVAAVPICRDLEVLLHGTWWPYLRKKLSAFQAGQRLAGGDAWLAFVALIVITIAFLHSPASQHLIVGKSVTPELVAFVRDHPDRFHRPLTTTRNAGPLLWYLRPDFRVSFDDRGDFYGDKTVFAFVDLFNGEKGWQETLEKGNYDSAILDPGMTLNQLLPFLPDWKEVYRDKKTVVYWRKSTVRS